jgi:hypothetical protein
MSVALLDEIAQRLMNLEKLAKATQPIGAVEPIEKFVITDVRRHMPLVKPWFSVSIINDDDHNDVFCIVNTEKSFEEHRILHNETYNIAMITAVIKDLLFWCNHGESAVVRIVGTR